jgi:hypothetical protein
MAETTGLAHDQASSRMTVELSTRAEAVVERAAKEIGADKSEVFRRALEFYLLALKAQREGKHLGIINSDGQVEAEIAGL